MLVKVEISCREQPQFSSPQPYSLHTWALRSDSCNSFFEGGFVLITYILLRSTLQIFRPPLKKRSPGREGLYSGVYCVDFSTLFWWFPTRPFLMSPDKEPKEHV